MNLYFPDETATLTFAARLYRALPVGSLIFLRGQLGAGKTALVRGCLRAAGYTGAVKSPTFTLVEEYCLQNRPIYHFDLYRLNDPEELEWMGIRDYLRPDALCFIEWPERGAGVLPLADIELALDFVGTARTLQITPYSERGQAVVKLLSNGI